MLADPTDNSQTLLEILILGVLLLFQIAQKLIAIIHARKNRKSYQILDRLAY